MIVIMVVWGYQDTFFEALQILIVLQLKKCLFIIPRPHPPPPTPKRGFLLLGASNTGKTLLPNIIKNNFER